MEDDTLMEDIGERFAVYVLLIEDREDAETDLRAFAYEPALIADGLSYDEASNLVTDVWIAN